MAAKFNREATLEKIQLMQKRLEASLKDVLKRADRAEKSVHALLAQSRSEIDGVRGKIEKQIATLKAQAKAIADAERAKRRARRGS